MRAIRLYSKLSFRNVIRNKHYFYPFLFSMTVFVAMLYILLSIKSQLPPDTFAFSSTLTILELAAMVVSIFALIVSVQTNRFLRRSRMRELGLYSVLGMRKIQMAIVSLLETLIVVFFSLILGLVFGGVLSRLFALIFVKILGVELAEFGLSLISALYCMLLLGAVFIISSIGNLISTSLMNPIKILRSARFAEKEPKALYLPAVIGFALLVMGYYVAMNTDNPFNAIPNFMKAVLFVIFGTYLVVMFGFTVAMKLLKKNKSFYYKKSNFISVSSLMYRVKQNAMALSTIVILSCAVIVTLSFTIGLYSEVSTEYNKMYAKDFALKLGVEVSTSKFTSADALKSILAQKDKMLLDALNSGLKKDGLSLKDAHTYKSYRLFLNGENTINVDGKNLETALLEETFSGAGIQNLDDFQIMSQGEFNKLEYKIIKEKLELKEGEAAIIALGSGKTSFENLSIGEKNYKISKVFWKSSIKSADAILVLKDEKAVYEALEAGNLDVFVYLNYEFDLQDENGRHYDATNYTLHVGDSIDYDKITHYYESCNSRDRKSAIGAFGTLMFIGAIISFVFLVATALIMYYKMYSEGVDDRKRYKTMNSVGLSSKEANLAIRKQTAFLFFAPLFMAFLHLVFASFSMNSMGELFLGIIGDSLVFNNYLLIVCAMYLVVYLGIYKMSNGAYLRGVRGK